VIDALKAFNINGLTCLCYKVTKLLIN